MIFKCISEDFEKLRIWESKPDEIHISKKTQFRGANGDWTRMMNNHQSERNGLFRKQKDKRFIPGFPRREADEAIRRETLERSNGQKEQNRSSLQREEKRGEKREPLSFNLTTRVPFISMCVLHLQWQIQTVTYMSQSYMNE